MEKHDKLVKALRCCISKNPPETCVGCTYNKCNNECAVRRMILDAADAIEALQAEVEELKAKKMKLAENSLRFVGKVRELDKRRLEPKQGEWIEHGEPPMLVIECSVCGQKYFNHALQEKAKYCSMCGAKMEVQDESVF